MLQDIEAQRRAAVEKNVTGAEQKDDLIQCRIGFDIDQAQYVRADQHADDEKHRDIGNFNLLSQEARDGADGQNEPAGHQRMLRNFN